MLAQALHLGPVQRLMSACTCPNSQDAQTMLTGAYPSFPSLPFCSESRAFVYLET